MSKTKFQSPDSQKIVDLLYRKIDESHDNLRQEFNEKISHLPTKEEFLSREDEVIAEMKAVREEMSVLSYQVSGHNDRITALESLHPRGKHLAGV